MAVSQRFDDSLDSSLSPGKAAALLAGLAAEVAPRAVEVAQYARTPAALGPGRSGFGAGVVRASASVLSHPSSGHGPALAVADDPLALGASRARHPSSGRCGGHDGASSSPCGPATTAADAADTIRQLLTVAIRLLREAPGEERRQLEDPPGLRWARLERVARLRDELHVTANRVARFDVDEFPVVDPVRIAVRPASSAMLAPAHLLAQLELTAERLIDLLVRRSTGDWSRTCGMGERIVTLGELVDSVLDAASEDLVDLLDVELRPASGRAAVLVGRRGCHGSEDADQLSSSPARVTGRDAQAS